MGRRRVASPRVPWPTWRCARYGLEGVGWFFFGNGGGLGRTNIVYSYTHLLYFLFPMQTNIYPIYDVRT